MIVQNMKKDKKKIAYTPKTKKSISTKDVFSVKHLQAFLLLCLVIITFLIYAPALQNQFTNWDDSVYVSTNPYITSLSKENITYIFTNRIAANYHPLTIISLALNYRISKLSPFSYYLVNILFHLFNILLVYRLVVLFPGKNRNMALFCAALFAVHPMHVESVAWISARKDVLYTFFFLSGLIAYTRYLDKKGVLYFIICLFLFLLSALSKPTAVIFPAVLFVLDFFRRRKFGLAMIAEKIPFIAISLWIGYQTINSQIDMVTKTEQTFTYLQKFLFASYGFFIYVYKLFIPLGLSCFYPFPVADQTQTLPLIYWMTPIFNLILIAGVLYSIKYTRTIASGMLFYFFAVVLTLQFVQVGFSVISDRYTYLAYIGLLIALYWIIDQIFDKKKLFSSLRVSTSIFLIFFCFNAVLAFQRVPVWRNSETLWTDVIEKLPNTSIAYNNRGQFYDDQKLYPLALADYSKSIEKNPRYFDPHFNRGCLHIKLKNYKEAVTDFTNATILNPLYSVAFRLKAEAYMFQDKPDSALQNYNKAIEINAASPAPFYSRGHLYMKTNQFDKAIVDFTNAINRNQNDPEYWFGLGNAYGKKGNFNEAIKYLTIALKIKPDFYPVLTNRALAYAVSGKGDEALKDFTAAIGIEPENPSAYFNRAIYYLNMHKKDLACNDLQQAIKLGSNEARAIYGKECGSR